MELLAAELVKLLHVDTMVVERMAAYVNGTMVYSCLHFLPPCPLWGELHRTNFNPVVDMHCKSVYLAFKRLMNIVKQCRNFLQKVEDEDCDDEV